MTRASPFANTANILMNTVTGTGPAIKIGNHR